MSGLSSPLLEDLTRASVNNIVAALIMLEVHSKPHQWAEKPLEATAAENPKSVSLSHWKLLWLKTPNAGGAWEASGAISLWGSWLWGHSYCQHQVMDGASQRLVLGSVVLNAFVDDLGTDVSVPVWFAEDAKLRGIVRKAWGVLQEGLCDLDCGDRNEVQQYKGKCPSPGGS